MASNHDPRARDSAEPAHGMRNELDELVRLVAAGAEYRGLAPELIATVGARELTRRRTMKEAVKATRSKLHQVAGAYFARQEYDRWLGMLREAAATGSRDDLKAVCRAIMSHHSSTRERLSILDDLYANTLAGIGPIRGVLDVACGLNPLALPWMPLAPDAEYIAYDVYPELAAFLDAALPLLGVRGVARVADVTTAPPAQHVDVALVLKALPCLEQLDKSAGARLLEALDAEYILVTYPVRSLGGRGKGMVATYDAHLRRLVEGHNWTVRRYEFASELAFVIAKGGAR
ncbi:MAG: 16S rRNA methyltransferase [Ktedonobacterales bacterium]